MSDSNSKRTNKKLQVIDLTAETFQFEASGFNIAGFVANDGKQWFSAQIVCDNLDIRNVSDAVSRLPYEDKAIIVLTDNGLPVRQLVTSRSGVFRLIFRSRKAEARQYQDWVFDDVLPAIHEHGGYISSDATQQQIAALQEKLNDARQVNAWLATTKRAGYFLEQSTPREYGDDT